MDKITRLRERRQTLKEAQKEVRSDLAALVDEGSFVELSAFSYSKDAYYKEGAEGEGIVAGFATVGGLPFYVIAQNFAENAGGLTLGACRKIAKTLEEAERASTPVIYLLRSHGVRVGEGIPVLEGIADVLKKSALLKGNVLQFAVLCGEVYGSSALLASMADAVIFLKDAVLSLHSPLVLTARAGKNEKPAEVGGYAALSHTALPAVEAKDLRDAATKILAVSDIVSLPETDADLNEPIAALNEVQNAETLSEVLASGIELGANSYPEVKTVLGRIGGIAVAALILDRAKLQAGSMMKATSFLRFARDFGLPFVTFADVLGAEDSLSVQDSAFYLAASDFLTVLAETSSPKLAVVTGSAVGVGYSLFAAKSAGYDYTVALATAEISLFAGEESAEIYREEREYYETLRADPFHAAREGYLDDIVEPQFLAQYLTASLQMLLR